MDTMVQACSLLKAKIIKERINGLFHFKSIQAYGRHFLLMFCTPEIQGDCMNFSPGKLGDCFEHSGIQGMFLEVPGFQGVLHNDPGFPGVSVQPP